VSARTAIVAVVTATLLGAGPAASQQEGASASLSTAETEALRWTLYHAGAGPTEGDETDALLRELRISFPSLPDESFARIEERVRHDITTRRLVHELREVRLRWSRRPSDSFLFWWNPRQRDLSGLPSRAPTASELKEIEELLRFAEQRFGVEVEGQIPFRVDKAAPARVFPRSDLRWGISSPEIMDFTAVAKVALLESSDVPYLVEPLAALSARCRGDEDCESEVLDEARATLLRTGYVAILDGLGAQAVAGPDDPAFASALLALDHVERVQPRRVTQELLRNLKAGMPRERMAEVIASATRESPRRLDREVQRELAEWARQRGSPASP
jgi:hypothetical protein